MKLVFFDVDGTLIVPIYKNKKGKMVVGFSDEEWFEYCETQGEKGYQYCKPVMPVIRYAREKKAEGAKLFVLSTAQTPGEIKAKEHYAEVNFPGLFDEVITVPHDHMKVEVIEAKAEEEGVQLSDCELVEDTYANVLKANDAGIVATHISSLVCDL
ncbi:MAG: HAD-IA family hydrolase [Lachnospiraceae bacterium]|nr:HAD-IA family hydrolase [Lachnospiraceae bacterium]